MAQRPQLLDRIPREGQCGPIYCGVEGKDATVRSILLEVAHN